MVFATTVRVTCGGSQSAAATKRFGPSVVVAANAASAPPLRPSTKPIVIGTRRRRLRHRFIGEPPSPSPWRPRARTLGRGRPARRGSAWSASAGRPRLVLPARTPQPPELRHPEQQRGQDDEQEQAEREWNQTMK